jgi:hypothetical protein
MCAPLLGKTLADQGEKVYILDIDTRFSKYGHFIEFDLYRPKWLGVDFDIILCDPPFFNVSLSQLFDAIRLVSQNNFNQRLLLGYLTRRAANIEGTFAEFQIKRTGIRLSYQTVQPTERNDIQLFTNVPESEIAKLQQAIQRS